MGKLIGWFLSVVFGLFFLLWIVGTVGQKSMTPAEKAAKEREDNRVAKVAFIASTLKENMRDPESVVWESMLSDEDAQTICIKYRGRNGFGGMSREVLVLADGKASQKEADWNRICPTLGHRVDSAQYFVR